MKAWMAFIGLLAAGCSQAAPETAPAAATGGDAPAVATLGHAGPSADLTRLESPAGRGGDMRPPGPNEHVTPAAAPDNCPLEKMKRPEWHEAMKAKAANKARLPLEIESAMRPPAPSAETLAAQQRFLAEAAARRSELEALDPAERERTYDNLKKTTLGQ